MIDRRSFVGGALTGAVGIGALGIGTGLFGRAPGAAGSGGASAKTAGADGAKTTAGAGGTGTQDGRGTAGATGAGAADAGAAAKPWGVISYSQMGEDIVLFHLLRFMMKIEHPSYLDIGAADPIEGSNTYLLHWNGGHGVLVEPNPAYQARLHMHRPHDTILAMGIGVTDAAEADYYVIRGEPTLNTFSADDVAILRKRAGHDVVEKVIRMPLVSINRLIAEHLGGAAPDLLSIDVEGLDFAILRTLDLRKYRPAAIIAETLPRGPIPRLLASKGYEIRGASLYNTIFADPRRYARG